MINKYTIALAIMLGGFYYVRNHYDYDDLLKVAAKDEGNPRSEQIEYYVGTMYYSRSDFPRAEKAFDQLLLSHPTSYYAPKALMRLGLTYTEQNKWPQAREAYFKYLTYFPDHESKNTVEKRWEAVKFKDGNDIHGHLDEVYSAIPERAKP